MSFLIKSVSLLRSLELNVLRSHAPKWSYFGAYTAVRAKPHWWLTNPWFESHSLGKRGLETEENILLLKIIQYI